MVLASFSHVNAQEVRIAALAPHLTEWVYELGLEEQLVAVSSYSDYPEAARTKPVVADINGVHLERLLRFRPTHVLLWQDSSHPSVVAKLNDLGIKVFISKPKAPEDVLTELTAVAELFDKPNAPVLTRYNKALLELKTRFATGSGKRAFYQLWHSPITSAAQGTWIHNLMSVCGYRNITAKMGMPYPTLTQEYVLMADPEIIFISHNGEITGTPKDWQNFSLMTAVKNQQVYYVNANKLSRFTPRMLSELKKLCELGYPKA